MPRLNRYGLLFEDIHPQTGALWGNLRRACDGRTYCVGDVAIARLGSATPAGGSKSRMIASRQCRRRGAFRTQLRDSASRLRAASRHREGCRTLVARCHAADTQNICNAISSMRPVVGLLKERRFALACNVLGRHEIFFRASRATSLTATLKGASRGNIPALTGNLIEKNVTDR
jgi:hypothetical protein